ncbi:putative beta-glucosidase [Thelonectria olida]|uniref:beta-glucosidase n=1 Tax=Thelonectria olida TaxID=1576542 RepID=A0A9P8VXH8_9HYPO|nr:putative beta-glucosidase [Thelonectria olida]KAH6879888.1 putative beta-glucosidase [Thelonectria olida]
MASQKVTGAPKGLPSNFEWGFATASYQIEGGVNEDGRGPTIWDTFTHLEPSRTHGANGDVACDHYHRYEEDLDLLAKYGAKAYRFSLAWSRIIPIGGRDDPINEAGIAFYNKLIDGLLARGITPWITLYHWDLPQGLQDRYGGWLNIEEIQKDFERYARVCYERFGDRVKNWITLNEPWVVSIHGFSKGCDAPGRSSTNKDCTEGDSTTEPWIVGHALILSHARAARLYNKEFKPSQGGSIGVSISGDYFLPWDPEDPKDQEAAERRMDFWQGWFAHSMFLAKDYPEVMREQLGYRLPKFTEDDFALLREAELDFYGMNYYTSQFARHRTTPASDTDYSGNVDDLPENKAGESIGELSGMYWLRSVPQGFRKHLVRIYKKYGKPIYVTENGCPCPGEEKMTKEESVKDGFRQKYFIDHLDAIIQARQDGAEINGYFAWSLMDNLEWTEGYGPRFGVTFTDYDTLERTPKESALKLRGMIEERIKA